MPSGDEWETILCDKPAMVKAPPLIGGVTKATLAEFRRKSLDLEKMASEAKLHSNGTASSRSPHRSSQDGVTNRKAW